MGSLVFLAPALALYTLFVLWPIVQVLWLALLRWNGYGSQTFVGLANFEELLGDPNFQRSMIHSVIWMVGGVLIATTLGFALAFLASRSRARSLFLGAILFPALLSATAVATAWELLLSPYSSPLIALMRRVGLPGIAPLGDPHQALPALFLAWLWSVVGVSALLLYAGMRHVDREFIDLARADGASSLQLILRVIAPAVRRSLGLVMLINGALAAQVFDLVYITTGGGPGYATMILALDEYDRAFGGRVGQGAASGTLQIAGGLILAAAAASAFVRAEPMSAGEQHDGIGTWHAFALAGVVLLVLLFPLGWILFASLTGQHVISLWAPGEVGAITGHNLVTVWRAGMGQAWLDSALLAIVVVVGVMLLAIPASFALAHRIQPGRIRTSLLILWLFGLVQPTPVLVVPLFAMLRWMRLLDSFEGVVLPEIARVLPFAVLLMWGALASSPREVMDASSLDGASPFGQMLKIALPMSRPTVVAVAVWVYITSWNEYLLPTVVFQDGTFQTVPTLLASFIGAYNTQFGLLSAGCVFAVGPVAILYVMLMRPLKHGLRTLEGYL